MSRQGGEYLWDKSGPVDDDVARLEAMLRPMRVGPMAAEAAERWRAGPASPERHEQVTPVAEGIERRAGLRRAWLAAAAMVMLTLLGVRIAHRPASGEWAIASLEGLPQVAGRTLSGSGSARVGEWIETDGSSRAAIADPSVGTVVIEPGTRVRLSGIGPGRHVMELARGRIEATIHAPPRVFFVDTPSARAIDLGCAYVMEVEEDGTAVLRVTLGYVELAGHGKRAWVPMGGGMCRVAAGAGPGTPYFEDAGTEFVEGLAAFDRGDVGAMEVVLALARPRDALSLWHLLSRTEGQDRRRVYERLAELKPPPEGLDAGKVMRLDEEELERWLEWMRPF
ncbi:MAG: hypothetical protein ACKVW3_03800 [Phycisphaerales bacterium]